MLQYGLHARTFKLENAGAFPFAQQIECFFIAFRDVSDTEIRYPFSYESLGVLNEGEGFQSQKIHFHETAILELLHGVLRGNRSGLRVAVERHVFRECFLSYDDSCRVRRRMPVEPFELQACLHELLVYAVFFRHFFELRFLFERFFEAHFRALRHEFGYGIRFRIRDIQHASHIPYDGLRFQGSEGYDLAYSILAVFLGHIVYDFLPSHEAEIDVEIRHGDAFRIQKSFEEQVILEGIYVGYTKRICDNGPRPRSTARTDRNTVILREIDEIPHDKEVTGESHAYDNIELVFRSRFQFWQNIAIAFTKAFHCEMPEEIFGA